MNGRRSRWSLLTPLLALVSVLTAGLVSAAPTSAAVVTDAASAPAACSSFFAAEVMAVQPENRVKGFLAAGPPRTGVSTSVSPNSVRGFDLFLRFSTSGVTVYVNGDPVNLVDPSGHEPRSSFTQESDVCYGPHASVAACRALEITSVATAGPSSRTCGGRPCPQPGPAPTLCTQSCEYQFVCIVDPNSDACLAVVPISDVPDGTCQVTVACVVVGRITANGPFNPNTDPTAVAFAKYLSVGLGFGKDTADGLIHRASILGRVLRGGDAAGRSWAAGLLPDAGRLAKQGFVQALQRYGGPLTFAIDFGVDLANGESPAKAIVVASTSAFASAGGILGGALACAPLDEVTAGFASVACGAAGGTFAGLGAEALSGHLYDALVGTSGKS